LASSSFRGFDVPVGWWCAARVFQPVSFDPMDDADDNSRLGDDIAGQLSDAARDLIGAGRALLDGAERLLDQSGQRTDGATVEQTVQRWVQLGQAAVAGFVEESGVGPKPTTPDHEVPPEDSPPIVGISVTDRRNEPNDGGRP